MKKILVLLAIAVVLMLGVLVRNASEKNTQDLISELEAEQVGPKNFLIADTARVVFYSGNKPANKVVLVQDKDGWKIENAYNAPADKEKVTEFLNVFKNLYGEMRADDETLLDRFKIRKDEGFHMELYEKKDPAKEATLFYHAVIGKEIDHKTCFIRKADSNRVYRVSGEIRAKLGLWGEETEAKQDVWLQKNIFKTEKEKIQRLDLTYPDKKLVFAKVEKPKKEKQPEVKKDEQNPAKEEKKEYEWKLLEGGAGMTHKQTALDSMLTNFASINISDVAAPEEKSKLGLDNPGFQAVITLEDGSSKVLMASHPDANESAYCYLKSNPGLIYKLQRWVFTDMFKRGEDLFSLPGLSLNKDEINRLELTRAEGKVVLERKSDGAWNVTVPQTGHELDKENVDKMLEKLGSLKVQDYTDSKDEVMLGLAGSAPQLTVTLKDGKTHTLRCGNASPVTGGFYVSIDGQTPVATVDKDDYEKLFLPLGKIWKLKILDARDVTSFGVRKGDTSFTLVKEKDQDWMIKEGEKSTPANADKVKSFLEKFQPLAVEDIALNLQAISGKKVTCEISLISAENKAFTVTVYEADKKGYPIVVQGQDEVYWLSLATGELILKDAAHYHRPAGEKKAEENKPADEKKTENADKGAEEKKSSGENQ